MITERVSRLSGVQTIAVAGAFAGLLSLVSALPAGLRFALLGVFVLVAPGTAVLTLLPPFERALRLLLTPLIGISLVTLASTAAVDFNLWNPQVQLVVLAGLTCIAALARPFIAGQDQQASQAKDVEAGSA